MSEFNFTEGQRANLKTLADYLDGLPSDYAHFNMGVFFSSGVEMDDLVDPEDQTGGDVADTGRNVYVDNVFAGSAHPDPANCNHPCGTAACAVGHGPVAGIPVAPDDFDWNSYARRSFGTSIFTEIGQFMFGVHNRNCPHAAAKRIRAVLDGTFQKAA